MKKTLTALSFIAVMAFASIAMATIWTATDNPNFSFGRGSTFTDTLILNGFSPGIDTITNGLLSLDFSNSGLITKVTFDATKDTSWHLVLGGIGGDFTYQVPGSTLADGKLVLTLTGGSPWGFGDLKLDSAILTANGYENSSAPVPEPATMLLLGVGMFGFAIYGKRRMSKED